MLDNMKMKIIQKFAGIALLFVVTACENKEVVKISPEGERERPVNYSSDDELVNYSDSNNVSDYEDSDMDSSAELEAEAELERIEEKFEDEMAELDRQELIDAYVVAKRKYNRQSQLMAYHKRRYHEKLRIWWVNFAWLELRGTPGIFAGDVPEKDVYAFMELMDACEELKEVIDMLEGYDNSKDSRLQEWKAVKKEVVAKLEWSFPSSGSPLEDALAEMRTGSYKTNSGKVVALTIKMFVERSKEGISDLGQLLKGTGAGANAIKGAAKDIENQAGKLLQEAMKAFK